MSGIVAVERSRMRWVGRRRGRGRGTRGRMASAVVLGQRRGFGGARGARTADLYSSWKSSVADEGHVIHQPECLAAGLMQDRGPRKQL